jgi:hypothetical protein
MKNKITKLKKMVTDLDDISVDYFHNNYPSYITDSLSTSLSIIHNTVKYLKEYESKNVQSHSKKQIQREEDRSKRSSKSDV